MHKKHKTLEACVALAKLSVRRDSILQLAADCCSRKHRCSYAPAGRSNGSTSPPPTACTGRRSPFSGYEAPHAPMQTRQTKPDALFVGLVGDGPLVGEDLLVGEGLLVGEPERRAQVRYANGQRCSEDLPHPMQIPSLLVGKDLLSARNSLSAREPSLIHVLPRSARFMTPEWVRT